MLRLLLSSLKRTSFLDLACPVLSLVIKERWQRYFFNQLNGVGIGDSRSREREGGERSPDPQECGHISKDEIKEAMRKMPNGKSVGPDQIPVEVWKCLGKKGLEWPTELFNVIFRTAKMPEE